MRTKEHFTALRTKAEADQRAAETSTEELNKFVRLRLKSLQKVGRSVLAKSFGKPARYRAPEGTPDEFKWVSQMTFQIRAIREEKNGTFIWITDSAFAGQREVLTKLPLEIVFLSDRDYATAIRKAVRSAKEASRREMFNGLAKELNQIRKNPHLSTDEKATVARAKELLSSLTASM